MNSIGDQLRRARESQGRSLDDIATATRINRKFLEEIEQGTFSVLPQTYVRAFIRAYANEVNLDAAAALKNYELTLANVDSSQKNALSSRTQATMSENTGIEEHSLSMSSQRVKGKQSKVLFIFSTMLLAGLILSLYWIHIQHTAQPVQEIVFQDIMKEWEAKNTPLSHPDRSITESALDNGYSDSLSLVGVAVDTVWMRFTIDKATPREVILKPKQRLHLMARDKFLLSLGNAGGISFTLNGKPLGILGKRGKPLGNIPLVRETLERVRKISSEEKKSE